MWIVKFESNRHRNIWILITAILGFPGMIIFWVFDCFDSETVEIICACTFFGWVFLGNLILSIIDSIVKLFNNGEGLW